MFDIDDIKSELVEGWIVEEGCLFLYDLYELSFDSSIYLLCLGVFLILIWSEF